MATAVVLLSRDLRVHDNPALAAACANAERVVPLFVFDPALAGLSANRYRFLHQSLADLRRPWPKPRAARARRRRTPALPIDRRW